jgi:hypothetical protein
LHVATRGVAGTFTPNFLEEQRYWVERAFRRTLGVSLRAFERAWARAAAG